ncbi:hypothetical protein BOX24_02990 [Leptospirillum ferriphilum]|uniref:Uncharacterized protein n=1 Tax=Leptospirillum ferriphilum TaxID=178606 RepID=A0A1V3SYJ0_9BACT|nr:hypothetical protein BOX24_02990 [Leptospirillum ferriphilum]
MKRNGMAYMKGFRRIVLPIVCQFENKKTHNLRLSEPCIKWRILDAFLKISIPYSAQIIFRT